MGSKHLPWLDRQGNILSSEELKTVSKNWDPKTWENFLDWQDAICSESIISPIKYDRLTEGMEQSVFESAEPDENTRREDSGENACPPSKKLCSLMRRLTSRQRKVIKLSFWENLSDREIARKLNISRGTVRDLRERSLQNMREAGF